MSVTSNAPDKPFVAPRMDDDPKIITFFRNFFPDVRKLFECTIFKIFPCFEEFSKKLDEIGVIALIISLAIFILTCIVLGFITAPIFATIFVTIQIVSGIIGALVLGSFAVRYFIFKKREEKQKIINQVSSVFENAINTTINVNSHLEDTAANLDATATTHTAANLEQIAITEKQQAIISSLEALKKEHALQQQLIQETLSHLKETLGNEHSEHENLIALVRATADQNAQFKANNIKLEALLEAPDKLEATLKELQIAQELLTLVKLEVEALKKTREDIDAILKKYSTPNSPAGQ